MYRLNVGVNLDDSGKVVLNLEIALFHLRVGELGAAWGGSQNMHKESTGKIFQQKRRC
jgi:hypothetical protein